MTIPVARLIPFVAGIVLGVVVTSAGIMALIPVPVNPLPLLAGSPWALATGGLACLLGLMALKGKPRQTFLFAIGLGTLCFLFIGVTLLIMALPLLILGYLVSVLFGYSMDP